MNVRLFKLSRSIFDRIDQGFWSFLPVYNLEHSGVKDWVYGDIVAIVCEDDKQNPLVMLRKVTCVLSQDFEYGLGEGHNEIRYTFGLRHGCAIVGLAGPHTFSLEETFK